MIGITVILLIGLWAFFATRLSKRIPAWLGIKQHNKAVAVMVFPVVLILPIGDEIIGRWQFHRLCEREAVVTLSTDWARVKRAQRVPLPRRDVPGALIRIYSQGSEYIDLDTGKVFMKRPHFYTYGGLVLDRFGLGLGGSSSCLPKNAKAIEQKIDFYSLLKQGEAR